MLASKRRNGWTETACSTQLTIHTVWNTSAPIMAACHVVGSAGLIRRAPSTMWSARCAPSGHVLATAVRSATGARTRWVLTCPAIGDQAAGLPHRGRESVSSRRPIPLYAAAMGPRTVVFVEPPYVCWDRRRDRVREGEEEIPGIGTLTLAAVMRERGHRVRIVDGKRSGTPVDEVALAVARLDPDHVGISATTISINKLGRIAARLKELAPRAVVTL